MSSPSTHSISHQPPTLATLPKEILALTCSFLPINSALELATVNKSFQVAAEKQIWRKLWLCEPKSFGVPAQVLHSQRERNERRDRYRRAHKHRVIDIMKAVLKDERRLPLIREVYATTYRYSSLHIAQILYFVRETLTSLRIAAGHRHIENEDWKPGECIHAKLSDFGGTFTSLRHLYLGPCKNCTYQNLLHTVSLAPNLEILEISAQDHLQDSEPLSTLDDTTADYEIPSLRYATEMKFDFADDDGLPAVCTELIRKAPNLRKVSVSDIWQDLGEGGWSDEEQGEGEDQFAHLEALSLHPKLEFLDWRCGSGYIFKRQLDQGDGFKALKFLVVDGEVLGEEEENIESLALPALPLLERLVIRVRHRHTPAQIHDNEHRVAKVEKDSPRWPIAEKVIYQLLHAPKLLTIQFARDEDIPTTLEVHHTSWEHLGTRGVVIRTFTNGNDELVHLQTLTRSRPNPEFGDDESESDKEEDRYVVNDVLEWGQACSYNGRRIACDDIDGILANTDDSWEWRGDPGRRLSLPPRIWDAFSDWEKQQPSTAPPIAE